MDSTMHGLIVDLNLYRPNRSLKALLDAGVDGFIFRIGGPSQWVEGDWRYKEDPTWRPYMDQAKKLGIQNQVGGYIVHNPFEDANLQGVVSNVHMNLLNQWTSGGYMPGYLMLDHERATCSRGATTITCTDVNLVKSLASVTDQTWKIFKKVPVIYTGRWFIDTYDHTGQHIAYLDNVNRVEKQRPMIYAGYPANDIYGSRVYTNAKKAIDDLPTPTSDYITKVLQCGSYSLADGWQFTDRLKVKGAMLDGSDDQTGVDASVTWKTWAEFCAGVNVTPTVTPPPVPPSPTDNPDLTELTDAVNALTGRVDSIEAKLAAVKGAL